MTTVEATQPDTTASTAPIAFVDTETTGLSLDDDILEIAVIRRDHGQPDVPLHLFVEHDLEKAARLPPKFLADHDARYVPEHAVSQRDAARLIHRALRPGADGGKCHVVGAVPNFDTERIARLLGVHALEAPWHHHLIDVENLAVGFIAGVGSSRNLLRPTRVDIALPWSSDDLSRRVGVEPPTDGRHTAMGDAEWARAIYDRVIGRTDPA